ncbi:MAG: cation transporter [Methylibium sp.]|uniref:cation diffusion facilitator family transporter n=1 Tax=Methylibium sp. TaxID=2067992 RepID=UPI0017B8D43C|nr:cation diffusion facilitator family transporter [Methylibium sp.]MBA3597320.1 cation transporter [Methylibium sp.]
MQVHSLLRWAIAVALATIALKFGAWWITGSVGLLSDAMESLVNLASAGFALAMVTIAQRPADADHPSGHSKAEYFSSGFEGLLIVGAAVAIVWAATFRWMAPQPLQALGLGLVLSLVSAALNGLLAWRMLVGAREHRSIVLEADARHLFTDVWTTCGVVVGLLGVMATGWLWLDPLLAIAVALNILREGGHLVRRSVEGLMDSAVEPDVRDRIDCTLARFADPPIRFDHLVTRRAGQRRFVDLHMHMPTGWSLGRAATLRGAVELALLSEVPGLRVSIQMLPLDVEAQQAEEFTEPKP